MKQIKVYVTGQLHQNAASYNDMIQAAGALMREGIIVKSAAHVGESADEITNICDWMILRIAEALKADIIVTLDGFNDCINSATEVHVGRTYKKQIVSYNQFKHDLNNGKY